MEITDPLNIEHQLTNSTITAEKRLEILLAANTAIARSKELYPTDQIRRERSMMSRPINYPKAFGLLGLLLGSLPPASIFLLFVISSARVQSTAVALMVWVNLVTAVTGYFSGKAVGKTMFTIRRRPLSFSHIVVPLIGLLWGAACGAAGGVFIFIFGAIFGAACGAMVGAAAISAFAPLHRLMSAGEMIEAKHFLPIAVGITLSICAFILSFAAG